MSSTSTATATTGSGQITTRDIETIPARGDFRNHTEDITKVEDQPEDEPDDAYLPANHGATGRETDINPPNWPTGHRRMPPYRQPVRNPDWDAIGGPLPVRIFMWDMFAGCQLLQVCHDV